MSEKIMFLLVCLICVPLLLPDFAFSQKEKQLPKTETKISNKPHPFLFLNPEEIKEIKGKIAKYEWAKKIYDGILGSAEGWSNQKIEIPGKGGGWYHDYFCPEHGVQLKFDLNSPKEHRCPADNKIWMGERFDAAWIGFMHGRLASGARDLGIGYAFTKEIKYAEKAKEILLGYANQYANYPVHGGKGKATGQSLDESGWVINLAWSYDLIYESGVLDEAEKKTIEENLLRAASRHIQTNDAGISNWQSHHNAAIGTVGFCIKDEELIEAAINGKSGFNFQMEKSVLGDGFWYEGSIGYHFYALLAHLWLSEAAYHSGVNLYENTKFKLMFDAPILYCFPDLTYPVLNDGGTIFGNLLGATAYYELAYARWKDPKYAWVLHKAYREKKIARTSREALFYGAELPEKIPEPQFPSVNYPDSGFAILRSGKEKDQIYLLMDYGPHGGGHGHPDKLNIVLYGAGRILAPDFGSYGYSVPAHSTWIRQSVSHNTVVVDETSQVPCTGKLNFFGYTPKVRLVDASADQAYRGVEMRRTLALFDGFAVDIFRVSSEESHIYDWAFHNFGSLETSVKLRGQSEPLGKSHGYQHIMNVKRGTSSDMWTATWKLENKGGLQLIMFPEKDTEIITAEAPSNPPKDKHQMLIARRKAKETVFISLLLPFTGAEPPPFEFIGKLTAKEKGKLLKPTEACGIYMGYDDDTHSVVISYKPGWKSFGSFNFEGKLAALHDTELGLYFLYMVEGVNFKTTDFSIKTDKPATISIHKETSKSYILENQTGESVKMALNIEWELKVPKKLTKNSKVYQLDKTGKRLSQVKSQFKGGQIYFYAKAKTTYEIFTP